MKKEKKAQGSVFGMSFGTLFSLFLIIFFVIIAFIAINKFLDVKKCSQIGLFLDDLQKKVDTAWNSDELTTHFKDTLPTNIKKVCFANLSALGERGVSNEIYKDINRHHRDSKNLYIYPSKNSCEMSPSNLKHIDLDSTLLQGTSHAKKVKCFNVNKGKISITIEKKRGNPLVILK